MTRNQLTGRQREVFDMIATGFSPAKIAANLNISVKTVSTYRARILEKLKVSSNAELATLHARQALDRAADHSLVAAALIAGVARWESLSVDHRIGEVCTGGLRYCTSLDEHGVPILTGLIRDAIRVAMPAIRKAA